MMNSPNNQRFGQTVRLHIKKVGKRVSAHITSPGSTGTAAVLILAMISNPRIGTTLAIGYLVWLAVFIALHRALATRGLGISGRDIEEDYAETAVYMSAGRMPLALVAFALSMTDYAARYLNPQTDVNHKAAVLILFAVAGAQTLFVGLAALPFKDILGDKADHGGSP